MTRGIVKFAIAGLALKTGVGLAALGAYAAYSAIRAREERDAALRTDRHVAVVGDLSGPAARWKCVEAALRAVRSAQGEMPVHDLILEPDPMGAARRIMGRRGSPSVLIALGAVEGDDLTRLLEMSDAAGHVLIYAAPLRGYESHHVVFLDGKTATWPVHRGG